MTISSNSRKAGPFIGNGTAATFPFTFKVFQASDLEVVRLTVATNVETVLILGTNFTASINEDQNSSPGGTITLSAGALATGFNLVITSDIENLQPTDLTNQGGFYPEVITDALDRATIQIQQLQTSVDRAALLPITSSADAASLVADIVRLADSADNLDIDANNIASINSVAGSISNVNTVATNISNVNTVAGVSSNVTTVATNVASVNTVAADLNEPVSEIETVAANITNVNTVGNNIANVNTVGGISANVTTVAGISGSVSTVATNSASVVTAATNIANINTVASDLNEPVSEIDTVATNIANVNTVGLNIASVNTAAGNNTNITTVATNIANVNTTATNIANVNSVAGNATNINAVAGNSTNINAVATNSTNINTAATNIAAITTVANDLNEPVSEIDTVATNIANVNAVGNNIANVNTVAVNIVDVNNFADVYQGAKATPPTLRNDGTALQLGDLYFNTTSNSMFVRASSGWVPAGSSVNGTSQRYRYIATAGQTTFTGTDSNGNTLTYDAGFLDIYLNGVRLDRTDFTASSGTSIVLASGAALNDELNIVAFGTFSVASFNGSGLIDGTTNISKLNATGTRSSSTFLAGDNTFKTVAVTPTAVSDQANSSTGYMMMPVGTTAQRPGTPAAGMYRMNTTTGLPEWYDTTSSTWIPFSEGTPYAVDYLIVAGGGAGGSGLAGGGGAGGYVTGSTTAQPGQSFATVIGAGGASPSFLSLSPNNGSNSSVFSVSSVGGGGGGNYSYKNGASGGSGGGAGGGDNGSIGTGGSATSGTGNAGGNNYWAGSSNHISGGGGGSGAAGQTPTTTTGGSGGAGLNWQSLGSFYAGGGGGAGRHSTNCPGGNGGSSIGGNGAGLGRGATSGVVNTGSGGGGGDYSESPYGTAGGAGGSGVVIIRYLGGQRGFGGTVTQSGGYTYHTFTTSGSFTA
jgi:hypothetical protein